MSIPPGIQELELEENKDLFNLYRKGQIGPTEEVTLFELMFTLSEKYGKTLKLRDVLKRSFDYTDFDFKRLDNEFRKWKKRQDNLEGEETAPPGPAAPAIQQKAKEIGTGATKALLGELQELGNILVLQYAQKAALKGESLKGYVIKSVEMREEYGDQMEAMAQQILETKALCAILTEAVKPTFKQLAAARMYLDWQASIMQLQILGYEFPPEWINKVTQSFQKVLDITF